MKILITGGCGFIGSNFIRYILKKYPDYEIVNIDALTYAGNPENLRDIKKVRDIGLYMEGLRIRALLQMRLAMQTIS